MLFLDIVIVNKDSDSLLSRCLESIKASSLEHVIIKSVVVIDNDSHDNSARNLINLHLPLRIVKNSENIGFGSACNQGSYYSDSAFVLFLNPDICLQSDTIEQAVTALAQNGQASIAGISLVNEDLSIQPSKMDFPTAGNMVNRSLGLNRIFPRKFFTHFRADQHISGLTDCVLGAFFLIRREAFEKLRGFDETFFLYYEELDLAKRLHAAGGNCVYFSDIAAIHTGGACAKSLGSAALEHSLRSKMIYAKRYFSLPSFFAVIVATYSVEILMRSFDALLCGKSPLPIIRAFFRAAKKS